MREYTEGKRQFNQTWWPERIYNYEMFSILLQQKIVTTVTQSTIEQIIQCGGFDKERVIFFDEKSKLVFV